MCKQLSLEDIKKIETDMLVLFAEYCDIHNLRYYLAGGTLLGAVRHKGFIPWDDDIDILMPRPDFKKFSELMKKGQLSNELIFKEGTDDKFDYPFGKLLNIWTEIELKYTNDNHIWIDIFPMDGLPEDEKEVINIYKKIFFWRTLLGVSKARLGRGSTLFKIAGKIFMYPLGKLLGAKRITNKLNTIAEKNDFNKCEYIGGITWGQGPQERMVKSEYIPRIQLEFEGHLFYVPKCYKTYLKNLYGDYMKLPPENERCCHEMKAWIIDDEERG